MDSRQVAQALRQLAEEIDPTPVADPEPFVVALVLKRDGEVVGRRLQELPCIGDGVFNTLGHDGYLFDSDAHRMRSGGVVPVVRKHHWSASVVRVRGVELSELEATEHAVG
jgi:hypothetical protein